MSTNTKKLTVLGMFCALAVVLVAACRLHIVGAAPYLSYDPKDVVIAIAGFLFGPLSALAVTVVVAVIEMITVSQTGIIGCVMNILSSASFTCIAALIYKKKHTLSGAVIGLAVGSICMTGIMLLWNYLLTPLYTAGMSREVIAGMLLPVFAPFNLIKSGLNAAIVMLLYKPVVGVLRRSGLAEPSASQAGNAAAEKRVWITIVTCLVLAVFVLLALILSGRI